MIDAGLQLHFEPDWRILSFLGTIAILTGLGFGLVPALRATRRDLVPSRFERQRLGRAAVILKVALSLLLVIGAGLLIQTLYNLQRLDKGFRTDDTILFELADTRPPSKTDAPLIQLARDVPVRIQQVPGVRAAAVSAPLSIFSGGSEVSMPLLIPDHGKETVWARYSAVSPGYLQTLGIKLFRGRGIEESDTENAPLVAVINESMARQIFPGGAIGKSMQVSPPGSSRRGPPIRVVGVVRDSNDPAARTILESSVVLGSLTPPGGSLVPTLEGMANFRGALPRSHRSVLNSSGQNVLQTPRRDRPSVLCASNRGNGFTFGIPTGHPLGADPYTRCVFEVVADTPNKRS